MDIIIKTFVKPETSHEVLNILQLNVFQDARTEQYDLGMVFSVKRTET